MRITAQTLINSCRGLCLLLILGSPPLNAQQDKQPFEFAILPEPLILAVGGADTIRVLNNTTKTLTLDVALVDESAEGDHRLSLVKELKESVLTIAPASAGVIVLHPKPGATPKPGTILAGYLVVSDQTSGAVRRKALKFDVPQARPTTIASLVGTFKGTVYYLPWPLLTEAEVNRPKLLEVPLPLTASVEPPEVERAFKNDKTVALLTNKKDGESALAQYEGAKNNLPGGTTGIVLGLKSNGKAGEYTGTLSDIKLEDGKPVTLTVISTHRWPFPALACFVGILIYYLMLRYLKVGRRVRELQEQEAALGVSYALAAARFAETAAGKKYATYSIELDFEKQRAALQRKIRLLRLQNLTTLDENSVVYKEVVKQLAELDEVARSWSAFAEGKLNLLHDALNDARQDFKLRPPDDSLAQQTEPAIASQATKLLEARTTPLSIAEFKARAAEADKLLPPLSSWRRLNTKAAKIWQKYDQIVRLPDFNKRDAASQDEIKAQREEAFIICRTLWLQASFDPVDLEQQLFTLDNSLAALTLESAMNSHDMSAALPEPKEKEEAVAGVSSLAARVADLARRRVGWDLFYLTLVTAVAIHSGLLLYYFDKPFGTPRDYLDLMIWGFSTKALLDIVTGAVNRFWPTTIR